MKILLFSDLHICNKKERIKEILKNEEYDLIISLGDNHQYDLDNIVYNCKNVPIYAVLGNHNRRTDFDIYPRIINLHYNKQEHLGLSFIGIEGSMRYKDSNDPMYDDDQVRRLMSSIPRVDVLVSHTGPAGVLADVHDIDESRRGFKAFNDYHYKHKPLFHFFGHYHQNYSETSWSGTELHCVFGISIFDTETHKMKNLYCDNDESDEDDNL